MTNLTILSKSIRQIDNLYSLNDLHKISGADKKHQPANFMRIDQTKELIKEINSSSDMRSSYKTKNGVGTFVCKELVYSYAMWISAKFSLMVIRAFDEMQNHSNQSAVFSQHGTSRTMMVYQNDVLVSNRPLKVTDGVLSFESPDVLKEMIRDMFPQYALVKKADILAALQA